MIIYSTVINVRPTDLPNIIWVSSEWLSRKCRREIPVSIFKKSKLELLGDGASIEIRVNGDGGAALGAWRYKHPDAEVHGRYWSTELGWRKSLQDYIEVSILLKQEEISALVSAAVIPTQPAFVYQLLQRCTLTANTIGTDLSTLEPGDSAQAFKRRVESPDRKNIIVVVSPTLTGEYLASAETLRRGLIGLAEVYVIPANTNTYDITHTIGPKISAYRGAVNVLFPPTHKHYQGGLYVPNRRYLADDIVEMQQNGYQTFERELFARVTHITNQRIPHQHISCEIVSSILASREVEKRRSEVKNLGDLQAYSTLLEGESADLRAQLARAIEQRDALDLDRYELLTRIEDLDDRHKYDIASWKEKFDEANERAKSVECKAPVSGDIIISLVHKNPTLTESLKIISNAYPDRVTILDSAWKSATEADAFKDRWKAFELVWILVTDYYDIIKSGKGDSVARTAFGKNDLASKESETVMGNLVARRLRTFDYNGVATEMMAHLRLGRKDSIHETWRCHFMYDAAVQKIVIGHCGKHLDHK